MLRASLAVLTALSATHATAAPDVLASLENEQRALFAAAAPGVVVVSNGTSMSAGFFVAPELVLTTAHGVLGTQTATITLHDGRVIAGEVVASSPNGLDLALLRLAETTGRVLAPAPDPALRAGDLVVAVGHGDGSRWSFASGMVSNPLADGADGSLVRLQLALRPGASGAPVVNRAGRLVGIVVQGDPGTVAFAVRSDAVLRAFPQIPAAPPEAGLAADGIGPLAQLDEAPVAQPLRAPEPIFGPPDPRPSDARALHATGTRTKKVFAARTKRHAAPAKVPVVQVFPDEPRETSALAAELLPAAALATAGLALAAIVLAMVAGAEALVPARPRRPRSPAPLRDPDPRPPLSAAPAPPPAKSARRAPASAA